MASIGYIGSSPDLLGLGVSDDVVHPYVHKFVAEAVVDKIRAVKNFLCDKGINENGQLFIAGYSEGGYVAMATHQLIEQKYADEFQVTASAPMAGPYDMSFSSKRILQLIPILSQDISHLPTCPTIQLKSLTGQQAISFKVLMLNVFQI